MKFTSTYLMGKGIEEWQSGKAHDITFIVTEDCNLRCKYCYQVHKNNKKNMDLETAKKAVDHILDHPEIYSAKSVVWEFIGGEPLLQVDLIDKIMDYIKIETYRRNHPWLHLYRFNICTNGILYDTDKVDKIIRKNKEKIGIEITIDGTKEKHDLQRVYKDGKGSYDDVVKSVKKWVKDYPGQGTKVTFGHEDLKYLKESIVHIWNLGITEVPANVVYEDVWEDGDDIIFEQQLKELADYILDNHLWDKVNCSLFDQQIGQPHDEHSLHTNYCGSGRMLAIDADGNLYPCLRFAEYSLQNKKPIMIGNIDTGIDPDKIRPFLGLCTASQSSQECIDCEVASGCGWCQGNNYDNSENNTLYNHVTSICKMHKARVRANRYYWDKLKRLYGVKREIEENSRQYMYFITADDSIEHCNYESKAHSNMVMTDDIIKEGMEFCYHNFYKPVILHSKNQNNIKNIEQLSYNTKIDVVKSGICLPYEAECSCRVVETGKFDTIEDCDAIILKIKVEDITMLSKNVEDLLKQCNRINVNFLNLKKQFPLDLYKKELIKIKDCLVLHGKNGMPKEVNVLTDRIYLDEMDNCNAGAYTFALAPNGKIYSCPAFYFNQAENYVGDLVNGINKKKVEQCRIEKAPICSKCDAYHCNRCIYDHLAYTGEYNTPSAFECKKSHIEREVSVQLLKELQEKAEMLKNRKLDVVDYLDPIELIKRDDDLNPYGQGFC